MPVVGDSPTASLLLLLELKLVILLLCFSMPHSCLVFYILTDFALCGLFLGPKLTFFLPFFSFRISVSFISCELGALRTSLWLMND